MDHSPEVAHTTTQINSTNRPEGQINMTKKNHIHCTACGKQIERGEPVHVTLNCDGFAYQTHCYRSAKAGINCATSFAPRIARPVQDAYAFADPRWHDLEAAA